MTETSIFPSAGPTTDAGIDLVPPGTGGDESDGGSRRRLLILGAIAGVIVLAAAAYLLLHKGSSAPSASSPLSSTGVVNVTPSTGTTAGKAPSHKPTSLPKVAKQPNPRDPFQALVTAPVQTTGSAASTTKVSSAPSTPPTAPVTVPTGPTTVVTTPPTTPPTSGTTPAGTPQWIQLTKTQGQSATFKVGYANHKFRLFNVQAPKPTASTGTIFGKVFALIGVQNGEATLQIGDATPFDLSKGVSHVV